MITLDEIRVKRNELKVALWQSIAEFMENHKEIAPNVFLTVYSDGSKTVVNYNKKDFNYKGDVVKALDFKLYKPVAKK